MDPNTGDGNGTGAAGAAGTPAAGAAAAAGSGADGVSRAEYDRLHGLLGSTKQQLDALMQEKKVREQKEAEANGEFKKLADAAKAEAESYKPYKDKYESRLKREHDQRIEVAKKKVKKEVFDARFKTGKDMTLDDYEHNLRELDAMEAYGGSGQTVDEEPPPSVPPAAAPDAGGKGGGGATCSWKVG